MNTLRRDRSASFFNAARRFAFPLQFLIDTGAWAVMVPLSVWARFDVGTLQIAGVRWVRITALAIALQAAFGVAFGLYRRRWKYGTFEEAGAAVRAVVVTTLALYGLNRWLLVPRYVPESVPIAAGFGALLVTGGARYAYRILLDWLHRPDFTAENVRRAVVFGAGEGGSQLVTALLRDPESDVVPVALLDDDPDRRRLTLRGIRVEGTREALEQVAERHRADTLVIAIPSADSGLVRDLTDRARAAGLKTQVMPSLTELMRGSAVSAIRDVTEADLLGRHPVHTDIEAIAHYLRGKRVLVTGAGGSIGSELCRQVHEFAPAALLMLDRDESALHAVQLSIEGRALLDSPNLLLADLRDTERIRSLFGEHRPDVVFHAAALKHLTLLERHPGEAIQSNVWGTLAVLEAAALSGVERFVNVSTDKAANPTSVLGYSKRLAEMLTARFAEDAERGVYLSVRFGNVLGSRGSMLGTFHKQIQAGGPVTVTHPDVTRFFMTVQEAVQLVIQAGAVGGSGEVLVLDMGTPVRIADVAKRLIEESGRDIEIVYTGLRPGEKLHEELFGDSEADTRPVHPLISHASVPALDAEEVLKLKPWDTDPATLVAEMRRLLT